MLLPRAFIVAFAIAFKVTLTLRDHLLLQAQPFLPISDNVSVPAVLRHTVCCCSLLGFDEDIFSRIFGGGGLFGE